MCGIAGWFSAAPVSAAENALQRMGDSLTHRGPDGKGIVSLGHAHFAHRRLAILDLPDGAQPMFDVEKRCCIVFNGEIYNFRELKKQLTQRGAKFNTVSDTEVILQLYLFEGIDGFTQLRGMYAFSLWDSKLEVGLLHRDPLGIKPLFVHRNTAGDLVFGSEAKAILARDCDNGVLDEDGLHTLMNFRYIAGDGSLFRGIRQLAPGELIRWDKKDQVTNSTISAGPSAFRENGELGVRQSLDSSVQRHLIADVEVGAYLSGGIDSATVVALANRYSDGGIRTFTVDAGDDLREAQYAEETAKILGVENLQRRLSIDTRSELAQLIWHLEVPKVNALQVMKVAEHASQHVKVALSGLGSDELFLGYNLHGIAYRLEQVSRFVPPRVLKGFGSVAGSILNNSSTIPWSEPIRFAGILQSLAQWSRVYGLIRNVWDSEEMRRDIYGPRMLDAALNNAFTSLEEHWPINESPVLAIREFEWRHKMVNDLLWQEDRCSMAMGLEVRVPFVDLELKQTVWDYGLATLMPKGEKKGLLKKSIATLLPEEILKRPKSGFQVDAAAFFESQLSALADEYLSTGYTRNIGLFNPSFIERLRKLPRSKATRWHYFMLYLMLGVHMWVEIYERGNRHLS